MDYIPVISVNLSGLESNPGFKITYHIAKKVIIGAMYGDLFMRVLYRVRPYEKEKDQLIVFIKHGLKSVKKMLEMEV